MEYGDNLISRKSAIDVVTEWYGCKPTDLGYFKEIVNKLPSAQPLSEEDYIELRDRFGDFVEFVVRDMINGKRERWKKKI